MDAKSILGPMPDPWKIQMWKIDGWNIPYFFNTATKTYSTEDPRLPPLPPQWEKNQRKRTQDDPYFFGEFRNRETGEIMNSDPRMLPAALEQRGVRLESLRLV
jgi:hypothetical protein